MQLSSVSAKRNPETVLTNAQEYELQVLNELIVAVLDNADERLVNDALGGLPDVECYDAGIFFARRLKIVESLRTHVRALDGKPATEASILGAAYAAMRHSVRHDRPLWLQKGDLSEHDDQRSEQRLERRFTAALSDPQISSPVKATIKTVYFQSA